MSAVQRDADLCTTASNCIPVMVERIVREFQPSRIILFGSYARGEAAADSDVDLLVVMPKSKTNVRHSLITVMRPLMVFSENCNLRRHHFVVHYGMNL